MVAFSVKRICSSPRLRSIWAMPMRSHSRRSDGGFEQVDGGVGQRAVAVFHLGAQVGDGFLALRAGDLLVEAQALVFFGHVALVDAQRDAEIELRGGALLGCSRLSSPSRPASSMEV